MFRKIFLFPININCIENYHNTFDMYLYIIHHTGLYNFGNKLCFYYNKEYINSNSQPSSLFYYPLT